MTEEQTTRGEGSEGEAPQEDPRHADEKESQGRRGISDGVKQGLGVLTAFKEALEETIHDARERGDLSAERAKELLHGAMAKAKEAAGEAKDRLDFVTQQEVDHLRARVEELKARLDKMDQKGQADDSEGAGTTEDEA